MKKLILLLITCTLFCTSVYALDAKEYTLDENNLNSVLQEYKANLPSEILDEFNIQANSTYNTNENIDFFPWISYSSVEMENFDKFFAKTFVEENPRYYCIDGNMTYDIMYQNGKYEVINMGDGGNLYSDLYDTLNAEFDNKNLPAYILFGQYNFLLMNDGEKTLLKPFIWPENGEMLVGNATPIITGDQWLTWYKEFVSTLPENTTTDNQLPLGGGTSSDEKPQNTLWIYLVAIGVVCVVAGGVSFYFIRKRKNNVQ